ncbi:AMP-binding protein [Naasia aerilata]|uniref:O-succinylbenzoic acid--CoA ligase n=1 Tax=Naasia aerilata TaxID=1162966 RepID=A0ABM8GBK4_9MICO|nr:AMP-binding protein [Naasia aerilata]BDZ45598.1 O-succinylbenzoic acid--CoA ligase [Naasia aerilata]
MRDLAVLPPEPPLILEALRAALSGSGPAVLPLAPGASAEGIPPRVLQPVAAVVQTSGSAGTPKRVALSANALLASAAATQSALGGPGRWILALPVHYIAGLQVLVRAISSGGEPVLLGPGSFDPSGFAAAVLNQPQHDRIHTALVPAQVSALLEAAERDPAIRRALSRVDAALVGGQRLPEQLRLRALDAGFPVIRTYGASETSGGCVYDGVPLAGVSVRIVEGEVQLAGPMLAEEYLGDPARTEAAFVHADGLRWYRTGDAGTFEEGRLRVSGRRDDVLVSGGEKVSVGLVEAAVRELPGLEDAVVVAAPSDRWGEVPVVVLGRPVDTGLLDRVRAAVGERLGAAARPDRIETVAPLPTLPSGKPDRVALVARLAASAPPAAAGSGAP